MDDSVCTVSECNEWLDEVYDEHVDVVGACGQKVFGCVHAWIEGVGTKCTTGGCTG